MRCGERESVGTVVFIVGTLAVELCLCRPCVRFSFGAALGFPVVSDGAHSSLPTRSLENVTALVTALYDATEGSDEG
jgi:hypothetical protein